MNVDSTTAILQTLIGEGYTVFSVEICHQSINYKEVIYPSPCVLVLGNKSEGVSDEVLQISHQ